MIANLVLLGLVPNSLTLLGALIVVVSLLALGWLARRGSATQSDSVALREKYDRLNTTT